MSIPETDEERKARCPDSETGFWITRGNGGSKRAVHDDQTCYKLHSGNTLRAASAAEVEQMRRKERKHCAHCAGTEQKPTGWARDFSAWDVLNAAKEGTLEERGWASE